MPGSSLANRDRRSPFSLPIRTPTSLAWTTVRTSTLPNADVLNPIRISECAARLSICAACTGPVFEAAAGSLGSARPEGESGAFEALLAPGLWADAEVADVVAPWVARSVTPSAAVCEVPGRVALCGTTAGLLWSEGSCVPVPVASWGSLLAPLAAPSVAVPGAAESLATALSAARVTPLRG